MMRNTASVHPVDLEAGNVIPGTNCGATECDTKVVDNESKEDCQDATKNHIMFATDTTAGAPKPKRGSVLFIDTGTLIKTNDDGTESVEEVSTVEALKQDFLSSYESDDDGGSFLSPIPPFTPEEGGSFKVVSDVTILETGIKYNGEEQEHKPAKGVHAQESSFKGKSDEVLKELMQRTENGGSAIFRQNYGEGSQKFQPLPKTRITDRVDRRLSFADHDGTVELTKVIETEESYYAIKKNRARDTLLSVCGIIALLTILILVVMYLVLNPS